MQAIACIDSAVSDAMGKLAQMPLWQLWGGYRDRLPVIAIGGYYGSSEADLERELTFFLAGARPCRYEVQDRCAPAGRGRRSPPLRKGARPRRLSLRGRREPGLLGHRGIEFLRLIEDDIQLRWFEEPTRWHADWRGLRDVRLRGNVNVAAGQSEISRVGMREMMLNGAIDVCNYDASWGGGPTEWRRVAALASAFDIELGHHEEAQVSSHLLASVPHGTFAEVFSPNRDPIF